MSSISTAPRRVFESRNFRLLQNGRFLWFVASQMQGVAVGWQVYALTGKVLDLGYVGLAQFAPALLLSLVTGHVADRYNRKSILLVSLAGMVLSSVLLFVLSSLALPSLWPIYAVLLLIGVARAFARACSPSSSAAPCSKRALRKRHCVGVLNHASWACPRPCS